MTFEEVSLWPQLFSARAYFEAKRQAVVLCSRSEKYSNTPFCLN